MMTVQGLILVPIDRWRKSDNVQTINFVNRPLSPVSDDKQRCFMQVSVHMIVCGGTQPIQ
jgi:hypothetical protein